MSSSRLTAVLLAVCLAANSVADDASPTKNLREKVNAVRKQQMEAQKVIALKKASVVVAEKRIAELQKQLEETKKRLTADQKSLQEATATEASTGKQVTSLGEQLRKHEAADALLAKAAAARLLVTAADKKHSELRTQLAQAQKGLTEAKAKEAKATADLKAAQEALPKKQEELTKARASLDAAGKDVDAARLAVTNARNDIKTKAAAVNPEQDRVNKAVAAVAQIDANLKTLNQSLASIRDAATKSGGNEDEAGAEIVQSIEAIKPLHQRATKLVAIANGKVDAARKQVLAAEDGLTKALAALRQKQDAYAVQSRAHFKLQLSVADLQNADRLQTKLIADAKAAQESYSAKQAEVTGLVAAAATEIEEAEAKYISEQKLAEAAMEPLGRFVSFSTHIAPIFAKRCVACHNTRTASGRLNMDSFAAIMKGGESGASFDGHDPESSILFSMIADGSMPKDADPLSKEQIDVIRKWISAGAPIDAGVVATADLFQVMPEIPQPLPPKTYRVPIPVTATAFNPEGNILASSGYHEILLWNTDDSTLIRRITNVAERVYDLEFSADGNQLAVAAGTPGQLGEVKLFSTADGAHQKTLVRTKDAVFAVSYSPDGKTIAAGGADRIVYAVDIESGRTKLQIEDHADWVMDVNWSPDGKQLVSSSRDKTSKVFQAADGRSVVTFNGHGDAVYSAVFLSDGQQVVSAGSDKQARVWKVADGKEVRKIGGFGSDIFRISLTPDNHLLSASADRNAHQHNLADGKAVRKFAGHKDWVYTLCYNAKRKIVATGSYAGEIRVWNGEDGSVAKSFIAVPQGDTKATVAAAEE